MVCEGFSATRVRLVTGPFLPRVERAVFGDTVVLQFGNFPGALAHLVGNVGPEPLVAAHNNLALVVPLREQLGRPRRA